jgi:hypothetical protein
MAESVMSEAFASILCMTDLACRNLDKVLNGGSQFGANQQLYDLYQR